MDALEANELIASLKLERSEASALTAFAALKIEAHLFFPMTAGTTPSIATLLVNPSRKARIVLRLVSGRYSSSSQLAYTLGVMS